jgi:hypothetical protein
LARRELIATVRDYVETLHEALGCVTAERLLLDQRSGIRSEAPYSVSLRDLDPVPLRGTIRLSLSVGQVVRIVPRDRFEARGSFAIETIQYVYELVTTPDEQELLAFHWTPYATADLVTFPHLHIGRAITTGQSAIRPRDIHKAHIPTGHVSLPAVVRLAITEFGVTPLRRNWEDVLLSAETVLAHAAPAVG